MTTICPETLAAKLRWVRNREDTASWDILQKHPRLVEVLCFVQDASHQPGGLAALVESLLKEFPTAFTTDAMTAAGPVVNGRWSMEQCFGVWQREHAHGGLRWRQDYQEWRAWLQGYESFKDFQLRGDREDAKRARHGFEHYNQQFFSAECVSEARHGLGRLLADWCEFGKGFRFPYWCPELLATLLDHIDRHAERMAKTITSTGITQRVFRELNFSESQRVPVQVVGDSRFGKTTSASVWCRMRPGRRRLLTVPSDNPMKDFLLEHAKAMHYKPGRAISQCGLSRVLRDIVKELGIFFVYDESQWLVPSNYSRTTKPARLNWIRSAVIDATDSADGRDAKRCAFFATQQTYRQDLDQFVKKTGFVMEQWLGRMAPIVVLPPKLSREDLLAVAVQNFPGIRPAFLKLIAARSMQSEGLLHAIEITAKRAQFIASEQGHEHPTQADIEAAIEDMLPKVAKDPHTAPATPARQALCTEPANRLHGAGTTAAQANRLLTPAPLALAGG